MRNTEQGTARDDAGRRYILPAFSEILGGYGCAREYCENTPGFVCGCPECLHSAAATLIYSGDDWQEQSAVGEPKHRDWGRVVVSEKSAKNVRDRIVPGYPGAEE